MSTGIDRRNFLGMMGLAGATLAISGCVSEVSPARSSSPAPVLTPANPASAKGNNSYWNHFTGEDERKGFEAVTSGFQGAYPGINFTTESIPNEDFMPKFTTAVQSGGVPDSVMVADTRVSDMVAMNGLVDITKSQEAWDGSSDIDAKFMAPFQREGKTYAIPCLLFVDWIYYRADWLKEAGISAPPRTWAEFRAVAKALTDSKRDRFGYGMRGGAGGGAQVIKQIRAFNGPLVDKKGQPSLDEAAVASALKEFTDMYLVDKSVPPSAPGDGYSQVFQSFLTGRTGMLVHHTGSHNSVIAALKPGDQVLTAPLPKAKYEMGWVGPLGNGLMSTENGANALAWLEYWGGAEPQLEFMKATGYFPVSKTAQKSDDITSDVMYRGALAAIEVGVTPEYFAGFQGWQDNTVLVQAQAILVGRQTIDGASKVIMNDFKSNF